jgi:hypothetical protein
MKQNLAPKHGYVDYTSSESLRFIQQHSDERR